MIAYGPPMKDFAAGEEHDNSNGTISIRKPNTMAIAHPIMLGNTARRSSKPPTISTEAARIPCRGGHIEAEFNSFSSVTMSPPRTALAKRSANR